jgi:hypothetical protein
LHYCGVSRFVIASPHRVATDWTEEQVRNAADRSSQSRKDQTSKINLLIRMHDPLVLRNGNYAPRLDTEATMVARRVGDVNAPSHRRTSLDDVPVGYQSYPSGLPPVWSIAEEESGSNSSMSFRCLALKADCRE